MKNSIEKSVPMEINEEEKNENNNKGEKKIKKKSKENKNHEEEETQVEKNISLEKNSNSVNEFDSLLFFRSASQEYMNSLISSLFNPIHQEFQENSQEFQKFTTEFLEKFPSSSTTNNNSSKSKSTKSTSEFSLFHTEYHYSTGYLPLFLLISTFHSMESNKKISNSLKFKIFTRGFSSLQELFNEFHKKCEKYSNSMDLFIFESKNSLEFSAMMELYSFYFGFSMKHRDFPLNSTILSYFPRLFSYSTDFYSRIPSKFSLISRFHQSKSLISWISTLSYHFNTLFHHLSREQLLESIELMKNIRNSTKYSEFQWNFNEIHENTKEIRELFIISMSEIYYSFYFIHSSIFSTHSSLDSSFSLWIQHLKSNEILFVIHSLLNPLKYSIEQYISNSSSISSLTSSISTTMKNSMKFNHPNSIINSQRFSLYSPHYSILISLDLYYLLFSTRKLNISSISILSSFISTLQPYFFSSLNSMENSISQRILRLFTRFLSKIQSIPMDSFLMNSILHCISNGFMEKLNGSGKSEKTRIPISLIHGLLEFQWAMVKYRPKFAISHGSVYFPLVKSTILYVFRFQSSSIQDYYGILQLCSRVLEEFSRDPSNSLKFRHYVVYFVHDFLSFLSSSDSVSSLFDVEGKRILLPGISSLFQLMSEFELNQIFIALDAPGRAVFKQWNQKIKSMKHDGMA